MEFFHSLIFSVFVHLGLKCPVSLLQKKIVLQKYYVDYYLFSLSCCAVLNFKMNVSNQYGINLYSSNTELPFIKDIIHFKPVKF